MFQIRHAGAKGFGVFASGHIARGTRILAQRPLLSINRHNPDILAAAARLSQHEQQTLLSLSLNEAKRASIWTLYEATRKSWRAIAESRAILNIFYNNNFALLDKYGTRALFPTVARINHSCVPNAQGNFNSSLENFTVHAVRDIDANEEITICYLHDELALPESRQAKLETGYGFRCACDICVQGSKMAHESHARRSNLLAKLRNFAELQSPTHELELDLTKVMIETYELEGLAGRELASIYSAAAGLAMKCAQYDRALALGAKGLELERDAVGEDSPFYLSSCLAFGELRFGDSGLVKCLPMTESLESELSYAPWT